VAGALDGFRILDVSQVISGPVATRILADQGADVWKVEPPSGDMTRFLGGGPGLGISPIFATSNRNKRSLSLDLKRPEGVEVLKRLARQADVFVQNFRPGAADRMGIGAEVMRALNPRLVYVSISGFGEKGPYAHKRVYDPVIQGLSGLTAIQGGKGKPAMLRIIVPDKVTALTAAQSITAALLARERTGQGQHLRVAMLDAVIAFMWPEGMAYHTFVPEDGQWPVAPDRRELVFETRDGFMIAGTVALREWQAFCRAVDKPEWLEDARFQSAAGLVKHAEDRLEMMAGILVTKTTGEWLERLDAEQVPCAPVLDREELPHHPQIIANEMVVESEHPRAGRMREARPAERLDGTPSALRLPAPVLGEHSSELLRAAGFSPEEIEGLRATEVVK